MVRPRPIMPRHSPLMVRVEVVTRLIHSAERSLSTSSSPDCDGTQSRGNRTGSIRWVFFPLQDIESTLRYSVSIHCIYILKISDSCLLSWTWDFRLMPTLPNLRSSSAYRTTLAHDCRNLMGRNKLFCIGNTRYQSPQNRNTCTKLTIIKIITTLGWRTRALDLWYSHGHILALPYQNTLLNRFDSNNDAVWRTRFPRQRYSSSHPININYTLFWLDFPPIR